MDSGNSVLHFPCLVSGQTTIQCVFVYHGPHLGVWEIADEGWMRWQALTFGYTWPKRWYIKNINTDLVLLSLNGPFHPYG